MNRNLQFIENNSGKMLCNKVNQLSLELANNKPGDKWTLLSKKKFEVLLNELRYEANKIKNLRFSR